MKSILLAALLSVSAAGAAFAQPVVTPPPAASAVRDVAYPGVIRLQVDATDTQRRIFRVRETLPVAPGPLTLLYPQWLPGNHAPRGAIDKLSGLVVRAGGRQLDWRRDPLNVYAFQVDVPAGVSQLELEFQFLSATDAAQGRVVVTPEMMNLQWQAVILYPAGYPTARITVEPTLTLPAEWKFGVALEPATASGAVTTFKPVSVETLVDSPMFAGRYYRQVDLDPGGRSPVRLNIVADAPENLEIKPAQLQQHRALVRQADRLFGARHYDHYDFLLATTDRMGGIGLEHHRSSENGVDANYSTDWDKSVGDHDLLPHEYTHSWNGKHRRGIDQLVADFNTPLQNSLLWVYEGQTQYWGYVLSARSGLLTKAQTLEALAMTAATYENRVGRAWRPLVDTTNDPIITARRPQPWGSWQRNEDYYSEGQLIWLDADTLIRERTGGRKSLDDFARSFFGSRDGDWSARGYVFEDLVKALNAVTPYDWATFLRTRVMDRAPNAPLDGLARGGYRLVYGETPSAMVRSAETSGKFTDLTYAIGAVVNNEGRVTGVRWDSPAFQAGLAVGVQVVAVNGAAYSGDRIKAAVTAAKGGAAIELLVKSGDSYRTVPIRWNGGLRYPRLERIAGTPARLDDILAAKR